MPRPNSSFDPRTLGNRLYAWYDASRVLGDAAVPADGVALSQWNDVSGNARHLVQGTGANQPVIKRDILGPGAHVVRFVDTTDTMSTTDAAIPARPMTVIAVFKNTSADDGLVKRIVSFNNGRVGLDLDWTGAVNAFGGRDDNAEVVSTVAGDTTSFHLGVFVAEPAGRQSRVIFDGVNSRTAGLAGTNDNKNVQVAVSGTWIGDVAELIVLEDTYSQAFLHAILHSLAQKWGLHATMRLQK